MKRTLAVLAASAATLLGGCSPAPQSPSSPSASGSGASCAKDSLATLKPGTLVVATGQPAFEPWVKDDKPETGEGFEAAVAYAVAKELGYSREDVQWVRTTSDGAIAPGPKTFDWNLQQYSISDARKKAVDFSTPYFDLDQAVVSYQGSPIDGATTVADLEKAKLGATVGSTSLTVAEERINPSKPVAVFNDNAAAVTALKGKQVDGIVVDLWTAFYLAGAGTDEGVIVGQLPAADGEATDQFGILLAKASPLTACTSRAVDALRAAGTLDELADTWLGTSAGAPTLS